MRTTIDKAGRLVLPKQLRDAAGIGPGEVEVRLVGTTVVVEAAADTRLSERSGRPVIAATGTPVDADLVAALRAADQR
jgi:AbrB family looped-hinge helix DNA binding protein